jgi:hypothetical protein
MRLLSLALLLCLATGSVATLRGRHLHTLFDAMFKAGIRGTEYVVQPIPEAEQHAVAVGVMNGTTVVALLYQPVFRQVYLLRNLTLETDYAVYRRGLIVHMEPLSWRHAAHFCISSSVYCDVTLFPVVSLECEG